MSLVVSRVHVRHVNPDGVAVVAGQVVVFLVDGDAGVHARAAAGATLFPEEHCPGGDAVRHRELVVQHQHDGIVNVQSAGLGDNDSQGLGPATAAAPAGDGHGARRRHSAVAASTARRGYVVRLNPSADASTRGPDPVGVGHAGIDVIVFVGHCSASVSRGN